MCGMEAEKKVLSRESKSCIRWLFCILFCTPLMNLLVSPRSEQVSLKGPHTYLCVSELPP